MPMYLRETPTGLPLSHGQIIFDGETVFLTYNENGIPILHAAVSATDLSDLESRVDTLELITIPKRTLLFNFDGSGSPIAAGLKGRIAPLRVAGTILSVAMDADVAGDAVVDIYKGNTTPLTSANSITAADKPTLSSAESMYDTTLTGWTAAVAADDHWVFNVDSISGGIKELSLSLVIQPSGW